MSDIAIQVKELGKEYRIGGKQERYRTFRETLTDAVVAPFRRTANLLRGQAYGAAELNETIWALKDVSFEVKYGEVIGIIGRNGAGKSTLLKILSRITEPSTGSVDVYGRVGSLLEVGTGFHPELTGRENIYLNGAILGMSRDEIDRKFDEIVAFAEVERFTDTPVKHYSSGMGLRLGFAVAAHLEPEILVVDEVLAVGDIAFQRKCLGKMGEVAKAGRTVLFVSHNMDAVANLCSSGLVLEKGKKSFEGTTSEAIEHYLSLMTPDRTNGSASVIYKSDETLSHERQTQITRIEIFDKQGSPAKMIYTWDTIVFKISYAAIDDIEYGSIILEIRDVREQRLILLDSGFKIPIRQGEHFVNVEIPRLPLASGEYFITAGISVSNSRWVWRKTQLGLIQVIGRDVFDIGRPPAHSRMLFAAEHYWRNEVISGDCSE